MKGDVHVCEAPSAAQGWVGGTNPLLAPIISSRIQLFNDWLRP
jgi:hypothetical protein